MQWHAMTKTFKFCTLSFRERKVSRIEVHMFYHQHVWNLNSIDSHNEKLKWFILIVTVVFFFSIYVFYCRSGKCRANFKRFIRGTFMSFSMQNPRELVILSPTRWRGGGGGGGGGWGFEREILGFFSYMYLVYYKRFMNPEVFYNEYQIIQE